MSGICFPIIPPINPLRLASNYRDYYGNQHERLTELTDPIDDAGCYIPRIIHAPDTQTEITGVKANGYLEYALALPTGSFILGFLHTFTSGPSANATDPPVTSGFQLQITDVDRDYKLFEKPIPEAWLLNDAPSSNPQAVFAAGLYVLNPSVRLLPAPYPITPPGMLKIEFWNMLATTNNLIRLSMLVAIPDPDLKKRSTT